MQDSFRNAKDGPVPRREIVITSPSLHSVRANCRKLRSEDANRVGRKKKRKHKSALLSIILHIVEERGNRSMGTNDLTSFVFHLCLWVGKWSARGKLSRFSGSLMGSPSVTITEQSVTNNS